ncbi:MAG TPA: maleylpyruvate isomerase N-terminal domain-containing protein [Actinomycetota bacterium]|nr:maleylpyruvate isomerase N-terminal domain-containing protein [Actinomycetota bacterium]
MGDLGDVYEATKSSIVELVREHSDEFDRPVPATPGWRVRDVVSHLVGDVECILRGEFPRDFFQSFGDAEAIVGLNQWTQSHLEARDDRSLDEIVAEWDELTPPLVARIRGEVEWPEGVTSFADRVIVTDLGVHQQDLFGTFGIERGRDGAPVKIGSTAYIAALGLRLPMEGRGVLAIETPDKRWVVGGDEPNATVRADRFELFRALSGRRNLDQLRGYDWEGDPEPFLPCFYPYGLREEALAE